MIGPWKKGTEQALPTGAKAPPPSTAGKLEMKFTVSRSVMLDALQVMGSVIPTKAVRPIAMNMHMVVNADGMVTLSGTDFEIAMSYRLAVANVAAPGEAVVNASRATAILREAADGDVEFETNESGKLVLRCGRSSFNLLTERPDEFPARPEHKPENEFTLNQKQFVSLIRNTLFAVARDKTRFAFNGASLTIAGKEAVMVGTNGKRLALMRETIDNSEGTTAAAIIPGRALGIFEKALVDDEMVSLAIGDRDITMKTTRAVMSARLVEGIFPEPETVIPQEFIRTVEFDRVELQKAFRQAALLTSKETRSVHMTLSEDGATLKSKALDAGEAEVFVDCSGFSGDPMTVTYNPDYIADGLGVIRSDKVFFRLNQAGAPARVESSDDDGFLYIIMPVLQRHV